MTQTSTPLSKFEAFLDIVKTLRGPNGCPWDKEQTHQSLTRYLLEESAELVEAIESENTEHIKEELGDLMLQVVLHSEIARQDGNFEISDVLDVISQKMLSRHPHVFSDEKVANASEVRDRWQELKEKENPDKKNKVFDVPLSIPALLRSQKIGEKTKRFNFDWQTPEQVLEKVEEELQELKEAMASKNKEEQTHELGDLLFSLAQLGRHLKINSEQSLRLCNKRFEERFNKMLEISGKKPEDFKTMSTDDLEELWQKAKTQLSK